MCAAPCLLQVGAHADNGVHVVPFVMAVSPLSMCTQHLGSSDRAGFNLLQFCDSYMSTVSHSTSDGRPASVRHAWHDCSRSCSAQAHRSHRKKRLRVSAGADFEMVRAELEPDMQRMYCEAAHMWGALRREFLFALEQMGGADRGTRKQGSPLWRFFWAAHQRFFRHMCMASKVRISGMQSGG